MDQRDEFQKMAAQYRDLAEEAERQASILTSLKWKRAYLAIAKHWLDLADTIEEIADDPDLITGGDDTPH